MIRLYGAALACAAALTLGACDTGAEAGGDATLETTEQKASYAIGRNIGTQMLPAAEHLDMDAFLEGMREAMAEEEASLPEGELQTALQQFSQQVQQAEQARQQAEATDNAQAGEAYMAENAAREGVTTTGSGVQFEVIEPGEGATPGPEDEVTIHYEGTLVDGTVFDTSRDGDPATFRVGGVIPGFAEGLQMMQEGGTYRLVIPGDLAYGPQPRPGGPIGPNETLIFEVEMIEVGGQGGQEGGQGG